MRKHKIIFILLICISLVCEHDGSCTQFSQDLISENTILSVSAAKGILKPQRFDLEERLASPEAHARLSMVSSRLRKCVVLLATRPLGKEVKGTNFQATGFVISKANRLVATAGHVADVYLRGEPMFAICDGSAMARRVERAWYHPNAIRELDDCLFVLSSDPRDGEITWRGPDIAVLQLSDDGPALPSEVILANGEELSRLEGQPIGFLSHPVAVQSHWPTSDRPSAATFSASVIVRATDGEFRSDVAASRRQILWYTAGLGSGSSGSPLFLSNGHVAGIARGGWEPSKGHYLSHSVRIDTLRELVSYHRLSEDMAGNASDPIPHTIWGPDRRLRLLRNCVEDLRGAIRLRQDGQYEAAYSRCTDILAVAPEYGLAWLERAEVSLSLLRERFHEISEAEGRLYSKRAYCDTLRCVKLYPWWNPACIAFEQSLIYICFFNAWVDGYQVALTESDSMLMRSWPYDPLTSREKAQLFAAKAQVYCFLKDFDQARQAFSVAIRLCPREAGLYLDRANCSQYRNLLDLAKADRQIARRLKLNSAAIIKDRPLLKRQALELPELPDDTDDLFQGEDSKRERGP